MKLGEKIRLARLNAGMTQTELAGDFITRNMLSQIENGLAMPSLQTALYIADRLEIDAGLLFSDGNNMDVYFMTRKLPELKKLYTEGEIDKCIELFGDKNEMCDEAKFILSECHMKKAYALYSQGKLKLALKESDYAKNMVHHTVYPTESILLKSEMLEEMVDFVAPNIRPTKRNVEERVYLRSRFEKNSSCKTYYGMSAEAKILIEKCNYKKAGEILRDILKKEKGVDVPLIYTVYCDYEICCREQDDYENAYKSSQKAKMLFEQMQL